MSHFAIPALGLKLEAHWVYILSVDFHHAVGRFEHFYLSSVRQMRPKKMDFIVHLEFIGHQLENIGEMVKVMRSAKVEKVAPACEFLLPKTNCVLLVLREKIAIIQEQITEGTPWDLKDEDLHGILSNTNRTLTRCLQNQGRVSVR